LAKTLQWAVVARLDTCVFRKMLVRLYTAMPFVEKPKIS